MPKMLRAPVPMTCGTRGTSGARSCEPQTRPRLVGLASRTPCAPVTAHATTTDAYEYDAAGAATPLPREVTDRCRSGPATVALTSSHGYYGPAQLAHTSASRHARFLAPQIRGGDECGQNFYRGSRPGEPVSFQPKPGEYKIDPDSGTVRPTRGVSIFDNRERLVGMGFIPHRIDLSSLPSDLPIIQQGTKPDHYEITPREGTSLLPAEYEALLSQIRTLD
jgi:hypothetical protein